MLVGPDGSAVGSVSGGCVEGAAYYLALPAAEGPPDNAENRAAKLARHSASQRGGGGTADVRGRRFLNRIRSILDTSWRVR